MSKSSRHQRKIANVNGASRRPKGSASSRSEKSCADTPRSSDPEEPQSVAVTVRFLPRCGKQMRRFSLEERRKIAAEIVHLSRSAEVVDAHPDAPAKCLRIGLGIFFFLDFSEFGRIDVFEIQFDGEPRSSTPSSTMLDAFRAGVIRAAVGYLFEKALDLFSSHSTSAVSCNAEEHAGVLTSEVDLLSVIGSKCSLDTSSAGPLERYRVLVEGDFKSNIACAPPPYDCITLASVQSSVTPSLRRAIDVSPSFAFTTLDSGYKAMQRRAPRVRFDIDVLYFGYLESASSIRSGAFGDSSVHSTVKASVHHLSKTVAMTCVEPAVESLWSVVRYRESDWSAPIQLAAYADFSRSRGFSASATGASVIDYMTSLPIRSPSSVIDEYAGFFDRSLVATSPIQHAAYSDSGGGRGFSALTTGAMVSDYVTNLPIPPRSSVLDQFAGSFDWSLVPNSSIRHAGYSDCFSSSARVASASAPTLRAAYSDFTRSSGCSASATGATVRVCMTSNPVWRPLSVRDEYAGSFEHRTVRSEIASLRTCALLAMSMLVSNAGAHSVGRRNA